MKEVEVFKEHVNKEKENVESKNLQFQNHLYQKENIISQINSCINFPTYEINKIRLPDNDEVQQYLKTKGISKEQIKRKDKLECELEMRKELNQTVEELKIKKNLRESSLKEKEKFMEELPNYFSKFDESTLKAQKFLHLEITQKNQNYNLSEKLPSPLYVIFNSLQCASKSHGAQLNIVGKIELVSEFYDNYRQEKILLERDQKSNNNKEEGEHSDDGEIQEVNLTNEKPGLMRLKMRRKNKKVNLIKLNSENTNEKFLKKIKKKKIQKFPLSLELKVLEKLNDSNYISIYFYYLPILDLVTVDVKSNYNYFTTDSLLSNIFMSPNILTNSIRITIEDSIAQICEGFSSSERFYDYIQLLSNNPNYNITTLLNSPLVNQKFNNENENYYLDDPNQITADKFLENLKYRVDNIPNLFRQLENLTISNKFPSDILSEIEKEKGLTSNKKPSYEVIKCEQISQTEFYDMYSKLFLSDEEYSTKFKILTKYETNEEGVFEKKFVKVPIVIYTEKEAIYYKITYKSESGTRSIEVLVEIGFDYPFQY
jgi:hypothetical protein